MAHKGRRPKILVIDDERELLAIVKALLEEKGYQVFCAAAGSEGIRIHEREHPDLVILDLRMPAMSGIETLRYIRAADAQVPVVILTAFGSPDTIRDAADLNVSEYLSKPFENDQLARVVSEALGHQNGKTET